MDLEGERELLKALDQEVEEWHKVQKETHLGQAVVVKVGNGFERYCWGGMRRIC